MNNNNEEKVNELKEALLENNIAKAVEILSYKDHSNDFLSEFANENLRKLLNIEELSKQLSLKNITEFVKEYCKNKNAFSWGSEYFESCIVNPILAELCKTDEDYTYFKECTDSILDWKIRLGYSIGYQTIFGQYLRLNYFRYPTPKKEFIIRTFLLKYINEVHNEKYIKMISDFVSYYLTSRLTFFADMENKKENKKKKPIRTSRRTVISVDNNERDLLMWTRSYIYYDKKKETGKIAEGVFKLIKRNYPETYQKAVNLETIELFKQSTKTEQKELFLQNNVIQTYAIRMYELVQIIKEEFTPVELGEIIATHLNRNFGGKNKLAFLTTYDTLKENFSQETISVILQNLNDTLAAFILAETLS